ncbi:conjugal transfer protein TrbH [Ensifer sp. 2YAB10]|uniref:conjugal transfer protein TrbH n=1 Tax=unclassified Ensifer TaxID=2633371 RepID=UPI003F92C814
MRGLPISFLTIALLTACQTRDEALSTNASSSAVTGPAASAIAGDMASRFAEQVGSPETTTINFDKGATQHETALEAALEGWGYTVVSGNKPIKKAELLELAYSVDVFDGQVLARLTTPSIALARAYTPTANGATPASALSVMRHN